MKVLAIDASNAALSLGLAEDKRFVAETTSVGLRNHAVRLLPAIEHMLESVGWVPKDIGTVTIAKGPGSYTGVRMGVTVAKTFAWSVGARLVSISSLQALSFNGPKSAMVCPIFDARREHVYSGLYLDGINQLEDRYVHLQGWIDVLKDTTDKPIHFIGELTEPIRDVLQKAFQEQAVFASLQASVPRASELAIRAEDWTSESNVHTVVPDYLKLSEAEANWQRRTT
ncbi:tRNA (adenosine(37)-N6)-threonylcarbamoyltransferase complex dimerization subunit type 1 TsaB [Aureibacillus halotolerans]|uniref:tRNA threonylcarbamoyladenosine biosynthesis protein TsaB n=1 Tax=Aureibacillus halotolerans TaxID=1508390 RepID=A0A4V3D4E1_9BACI|nr:tRNA (adenosine(37)-N6)-threonylcarbamoyltransferase complex dimerization subunit type 1 TsaB [Aureibacillus halotolerans]TDQ35218.1 tRNA threonylcarbamoyladenosine biosynthesis protein TsaB [Aureibacillus halotolerans]